MIQAISQGSFRIPNATNSQAAVRQAKDRNPPTIDSANPTAIRWGSIVVFGGAGLAATAGLVLMFLRREGRTGA